MPSPVGPIPGAQFVANGWTWNEYRFLYNLALITPTNGQTLQQWIDALALAISSNGTAAINTASANVATALQNSLTSVYIRAVAEGLLPSNRYTMRCYVQDNGGGFTFGNPSINLFAYTNGMTTNNTTNIGSSPQWRAEVSEALTQGLYSANIGASMRYSTSAGSFSAYLCGGFNSAANTDTTGVPSYPLLCFRLIVDAPNLA